jgi:hypothetical protein
MSREDRLGGDSPDGAHGKSAVHEFGFLLCLHNCRVRRSEDGLSKVCFISKEMKGVSVLINGMFLFLVY